MLGELVQIGRQDDATIRAEGDMFRLPLRRGYGTLATDHEAGLWLIVTAPTSPNDTLARGAPGLSEGDIALSFPALGADETSCLVSPAVANWLDVGYILRSVKVVE